MGAREKGGGRTGGVSFWPFPNSSGWWRLISFVFLTRTSCHKTAHANGYYGAWPGWVVSISVLPLTEGEGQKEKPEGLEMRIWGSGEGKALGWFWGVVDLGRKERKCRVFLRLRNWIVCNALHQKQRLGFPFTHFECSTICLVLSRGWTVWIWDSIKVTNSIS